jgi:hypothetical protein
MENEEQKPKRYKKKDIMVKYGIGTLKHVDLN